MDKESCACLKIEYKPMDAGYGDRSITDRWFCVSCGKQFVPDKSFEEKMYALMNLYPVEIVKFRNDQQELKAAAENLLYIVNRENLKEEHCYFDLINNAEKVLKDKE